jgi:hypothetical protein
VSDICYDLSVYLYIYLFLDIRIYLLEKEIADWVLIRVSRVRQRQHTSAYGAGCVSIDTCQQSYKSALAATRLQQKLMHTCTRRLLLCHGSSFLVVLFSCMYLLMHAERESARARARARK